MKSSYDNKKEIREDEDEVTQLWRYYENGKSYQAQLGLTHTIPESVRFLEGRQWAPPTKKTMNMPRPVFNIIEMIVDNKVSNVLETPVKLNFISDNDKQATNIFTKFADYQQKEMGQRLLDDSACEDGAVKGTYIYHYYWDASAVGRRGNIEGGLRGEIIDPLNIIFANPSQRDEQKQEWIMIVSREEVDAVREMADDGIDKELIVPDDTESDYNEQEQEESNLCTVLTRYFKKDGEVYFEKSVKSTSLYKKARPLNYLLSLQESTNNDSAHTDGPNDEPSETTPDELLPKAYLFPIVVGSWKKREKSIYGRGEVEGIIPNQKAVNFEIAMQLLNHQELGWGKILAKQDALRGQDITNTPGEIIIDHSVSQGWGITRLEGQSFSAGAATLAPQIVDLTRAATNSSEVITGDTVSKDLSGVAIAQLQAQSRKPNVRLQRNFWISKEKIGKILEMFYKIFYEDADFVYELDPDERQIITEGMKAQGIMEDAPSFAGERFNGADYRETTFNISVEAGAGSQFSEIMAMETLNALFLNGSISKLTVEQLEQYVTLYPDTAMPFKKELKAIISAQKRSELGQYKEIAKKQGEQIEQLSAYSKQQDEIIRNLQTELNRTESLFEKQNREYAEKITSQNKYIEQMSKQPQQTK